MERVPENGRRRVVVTGAAGFLGAAVARRLLASGSEVLCWIRPGTDAWRLASLGGRPSLLRLDLRELSQERGRAAAREALAAFRPDAAVHAAWRGIRGAAREDLDQLENVAAGIALLGTLADAGVRRIVGLGSQAEYGPHDGPISEEAATRPETLYGAAKLAFGHLLLAFARRRGISAAWVRVFSVYGPGEVAGTLVPDLARALAEGRPYPLGRGDRGWDFLHEDDAAEAIAGLAGRDDAEGFFNLGSGRAVPIGEVARRVADLVSPRAPLALGERGESSAELPHLEAVVTRLSRAIGWAPRVALGEGLAATVAAVLARGGPAPG